MLEVSDDLAFALSRNHLSNGQRAADSRTFILAILNSTTIIVVAVGCRATIKRLEQPWNLNQILPFGIREQGWMLTMPQFRNIRHGKKLQK
ncbi:hypothetical protein Y032_0030g2065 [Ancylostoma ceylanicum]|uniref:Uncharacterized protein n=1 Tax=Ancylostoma ceylanicum TaxID=53326 RepID=A0A016URC5_9BILA|nr:hypothetical protein Y032_0030g2065 [Ancylostoma ceylanicum]